MWMTTASIVLLMGLAACGGATKPEGAEKAAAAGASAAPAAQLPNIDQTAAPAPAAPVAKPTVTTTTRPAITATTRPAAPVTTTTAAPVVSADVTTTTAPVVATTTTTMATTTTVPTCSVAVANPTAVKGSDQTVTLTSDAPGQRFRLQASYPQFGTGKPNPRQTFEVTTDAAGGWTQTFSVIATSTVPVNVWATPYGDQGQLLTDSSCYAAFDAVAA